MPHANVLINEKEMILMLKHNMSLSLEHLHNDLDSFTDRMAPSRHATHVGEKGNACNGKQKEGDHCEDVDISGGIILKCILGKWIGVV
jgi:hypothetical protein